MSFTFKSNANYYSDQVQSAVDRALEIIGGMAESYAKMLCPVKTSTLKNSITHVPEGDDTEVIGTAVEYSPYVELGTVKMAARPYLRPAVEGHIEEYKHVAITELNKVTT